jgi:hypothetical protein
MGGLLAPPDEMLERRKSRSFEDLHVMSNEFDAMKAAEEAKATEESTEQLPRTESLTVSLEETIQDLQKANEAASLNSISETPPNETEPEPPRRPAPDPPIEQSPPPFQTPQSVPARSRSPSNAKPPVTLLISPDEIYSIVLSVLSVRSRQVTTPDGSVEESLFTIRCRTKSTPDKGPEKELLRVEKSLPQLRELSGVLSSILSMSSFTNTFFADFPSEKSGQRKVHALGRL